MLSIACSTAAPASFKCGAPSRSVRTFAMGRREAVAGGLVIPVIFNLLNPKLVSASKAGPAADRLWESLGGAKDDIAFPELFKGRWVVESTLISAATPQGEDLVPDMRVVQRARDQDLHATQQYSITFSTNGRGEVVLDRYANTASMLGLYMGADIKDRIQWKIDEPSVLRINLPGGRSVETRVTRRSQETVGSDRMETSEFMQQVIEDPSNPGRPRVKASQVFTKYHWRNEESARNAGPGAPMILATQVVSDFLTAYDGEDKVIKAGGKPVVQYTYKMAFSREPRDAAFLH